MLLIRVHIKIVFEQAQWCCCSACRVFNETRQAGPQVLKVLLHMRLIIEPCSSASEEHAACMEKQKSASQRIVPPNTLRNQGKETNLHDHLSDLSKPLDDICVQSLVLLRVLGVVEALAAVFTLHFVEPCNVKTRNGSEGAPLPSPREGKKKKAAKHGQLFL